MSPVPHQSDANGVEVASEDLKRCNSSPEAFDEFYKSDDLNGILHYSKQLYEHIGINPTSIQNFYPKVKENIQTWRATALWKQLDTKINKHSKTYNEGNACKDLGVMIIGAGPCGLRAAIEAQCLGAKVTVVEKRKSFSRNNVLRLWPFIITDLKELGAKTFHGKLGTGDIEHISIRRLQVILLKIAILLGVEVYDGTGYEDIIYPTNKTTGWKAKFSPKEHIVNQREFDALICADGNKKTVKEFKGTVFRASLAIAITANFVNKQSHADAKVEEIGGVSAIYTQELFKNMKTEIGIDLENIVYFKDETHYFVMTAKKQSLLEKGVIIKDTLDTETLLHPSNVSHEKLIEYAKEAAQYTTKNQLKDLEFQRNPNGKEDIAIFDFTNLWKAESACRVIERKGHKLLMGLIGDSLLEPFWPTGTGCARGFFSSFDTCWMLKQWKADKMTTLQVMAERESLFKILPQMTDNNIARNYENYSLEPASRYSNSNKGAVIIADARKFLDTDDPGNVDMSSSNDVSDSHVEDSRKEDSLPNSENSNRTSSRWRLNKKKETDTIVPQDMLLTWFKNQVAPYQGITVNNMTSLFKDGRVFCAIIHRYRPNLINMDSINPENIAENNDKAFRILEREFGIKKDMTGTDLASCAVPNSYKMLTYSSKVYQKLQGEKVGVRTSNMIDTKRMSIIPINGGNRATWNIKDGNGASGNLTYVTLHLILMVCSMAAFLTLILYKGVLEISVHCEELGLENHTFTEVIGYPLSLDSMRSTQELCYEGNTNHLILNGNYSLHCRFSAAVGILTALIALIMIIKYLLESRRRMFLPRGYMVYMELVLSVLLLMLWVSSSAMLVQAVLGFTDNTQFNVVKEVNAFCYSWSCLPGQTPDPSMLWASVALGFLCALLLLLNVIFLAVEKIWEYNTPNLISETEKGMPLQQSN